MTGAVPSHGYLRTLVASSFPALAMLYLALFGSYGTESPFFPSLLASRGLISEQIGVLLSAGTVVRLLSGPCVGILADRFGTRLILAIAVVGAGAIVLLYLEGAHFWPLLIVCLIHSVTTAPLNPLADALALKAIAREGLFPYGWVRGIGSAGFIAGTLVSGLIVARFGLDSIIVVASILLFVMLAPISRLPSSGAVGTDIKSDGIMSLIAMPDFRRLLIVSALVVGSHAMSDTFAVIHWRAEGVGASSIGLLWSEAVGSEIIVFVAIGPWLLRRVGPARCAAIAGMAGVLRWAVLAQSVSIVPLIATQCLHGFTFSLMHLVCMQIIAAIVPSRLAATAQTVYGTFCLGIASASLTLLSGFTYGAFGPPAFWLMAAICLIAIPLALKLPSRPMVRRDELR